MVVLLPPPDLLQTITREQSLPGTPEAVFGFFADAFNLAAITPPWLRFRVVTPGPIRMAPGSLIEYRLRLHGIPIHNAVATSAGLGVPITIAGTLGYVLAGLPQQALMPPFSTVGKTSVTVP